MPKLSVRDFHIPVVNFIPIVEVNVPTSKVEHNPFIIGINFVVIIADHLHFPDKFTLTKPHCSYLLLLIILYYIITKKSIDKIRCITSKLDTWFLKHVSCLAVMKRVVTIFYGTRVNDVIIFVFHCISKQVRAPYKVSVFNVHVIVLSHNYNPFLFMSVLYHKNAGMSILYFRCNTSNFIYVGFTNV